MERLASNPRNRKGKKTKWGERSDNKEGCERCVWEREREERKKRMGGARKSSETKREERAERQRE
jgi:hypothetical protein